MNKSFHAFTIAELTVAMLITGLLVTFGYFLLSNFSVESGQWISLQNRSITDSRAVATLRWDMATHEKISIVGQTLYCHRKGDPPISYKLSDLLTRTAHGNTDTFELKVLGLKTHATQNDLIDTLSISIEIGSKPTEVLFVKHYSSYDLMSYGGKD